MKGIDADIVNVGNDDNPLNYHNSWLYSIGASYKVTPKFSVMSGLAYDQTPTTDAFRDARIPDTNRKWVTLGCAYESTQKLSLFATYEHIFMNDQSIDLTQQPTASVSAAHVSADYSGYANIIAGGLNYVF
jgi:long-chain fatty acid transport protein